MSDTAIALNRFGLGGRPDEAAPGDPKAWLKDQFARFEPKPAAIAAAPGRAAIAGELADYLDEVKAMRAELGPRRQRKATASMVAGTSMAESDAMAAKREEAVADNPKKQARKAARKTLRDAYVEAIGARTSTALVTPAPFVERLVHFWSNHFAVSAEKLTVLGLTGPFEFEAIRPHVLGKFSDMVSAVERHPAMLLYLDQARSVGPNSPIGARVAARGKRTIGLNENLGREAMELHTLGVRTGYSQADVTEFARALTGWTVAGISRGPGARFAGAGGDPGDFVFASPLHEPGSRTIMGKAYAETGVDQAQAVLDDLSVHPATAAHIATKLAVHFVGDTPPPALVERMKAAFLRTGGDLPSVYRAMIDSPEAWAAAPTKFSSPWRWSIGAMRAIGMKTAEPVAVAGLLNQLGQPIWKPGSPAGYGDVSATWAGPDAGMRRVEAANRFAARAGDAVDARALARKLYPGGALSPATAQALARAESPGQALALLLVAPEAMRS